MYAEFVRLKGIDGKKIVRFKNKDLLYNLGIKKLGHRLDILKMVQDLFSSPRARSWEQMERYHQKLSTYSDSDESVTSFDGPYNSAPELDSVCLRWRQRNIPGRCRETNGTRWSDCDHEDYARHRPRKTRRAYDTNTARKAGVCNGRITGNIARTLAENQKISDQKERETALSFESLQHAIGERD